MEEKFYGVDAGTITNVNRFDEIIEEITLQGFSVISDLLNETELQEATSKLDAIYQQQVDDFGINNLKKINEANLVRCPLSYDDFFLGLCTKPAITDVVGHFLGGYYIINQQNGIINRAKEEHHQSSWHRDLPYQDYIISKPIAIACLMCIDDFTEETGATLMLPFSHQMAHMPSVNYLNNHKVSLQAKKGSAILFNAMLYHKAGYNRSDNTRRGLNTLFSIPLLKQQINLLEQMDGRHSDDPAMRKLLGYDAQVPGTVRDWRQTHLNRKK